MPYAHARQFKRKRSAIKRKRAIVGRLQSEVDRKESCSDDARPLSRSSVASRPIPAWTADTLRANRATGCMRCCVLRTSTSNGCCA